MNATSAVGRYPAVCRTYRSDSRPAMERGPKSSSGTEKRVSRRSKYFPPVSAASRRDSSDLAVPGGPRRSRCSPARAARSRRRTWEGKRVGHASTAAAAPLPARPPPLLPSYLGLALQEPGLHVPHGGQHLGAQLGRDRGQRRDASRVGRRRRDRRLHRRVRRARHGRDGVQGGGVDGGLGGLVGAHGAKRDEGNARAASEGARRVDAHGNRRSRAQRRRGAAGAHGRGGREDCSRRRGAQPHRRARCCASPGPPRRGRAPPRRPRRVTRVR